MYPNSEPRLQIFTQLRSLYSEKEKEIEDVVETLLKKEAAEAAQLQTNQAQSSQYVAASADAGA